MEEKSEKAVWISWCHDKRDHYDALVRELNNNAALDVKIHSSVTMKDNDWKKAAEQLIPISDAYVLLVSKEFFGKENCIDEVKEIKNTDLALKKVYPILIESCEPPKNQPGSRGPLELLLEKYNIDTLEGAISQNYKNQRPSFTYETLAIKILNDLDVPLLIEEVGPLSEYADAIKKGLFVPYIGPDCYGLRDEWQPHLATLWARMGNISKRFGAVSAPENLEADREYLKAVVMSHNPDLDAQEQLQDDAVSREIAAGALFELRVAVALAGAAASRLLGKSLSRCKGLIGAQIYQIVITEADDPDVQILQEALLSAIEHTKKCNSNDFCPRVGGYDKACLGPHHIVKKLDRFLDDVFKDQEPGAAVREVHLSLAKLDWLGDLLWHLMRFDLPIFPKPDELAFRLALCQNTEYFARIPFGTTAAIWAAAGNGEGKQADPPEDIANCSELMHCKLGELSKSNPAQFYRAIAKLLWNSYRCYEEKKKDLPSGPVFIGAEAVKKLNYPIVVSMNFDEELENCLHHADYSVLHPAKLPSKNETIWLLRVHQHNQVEDQYYLFPTDNASSSAIIQSKLRGPLIVKYRGSLRHNTNLLIKIQPIVGDLKAGSSKAEPRPLLSTFDYVRELSASDRGEPPWLRDQLAPEKMRVKCFLGYPLDDIDGILGIQHNVWVDDSKDDDKKLLSIGCRRLDGLAVELLTGLRVKPITVELNDFAASINMLIGFEELPKEGELDAQQR